MVCWLQSLSYTHPQPTCPSLPIFWKDPSPDCSSSLLTVYLNMCNPVWPEKKMHHDVDWSHLKYVITNLMCSLSTSSSSISLGYFLFYSLKQQFYNFFFLVLLTSHSFFPFFSLLPGNFLPFFLLPFLPPPLPACRENLYYLLTCIMP